MRAVDATLASPQAGGSGRHLRPAGRAGDPPVRRAPRRSGHPHLPGAPRAGCRPHGRRVREGHRPGRGLHGHLRAGRDQPRHPDRRRLHGLGAAGGDHRPGRLHARGHRRLPGGRHRRHHPADREALLPGQGRRRPAAARSPRPCTWPRPAAPARCWWTSASTSGRARSSDLDDPNPEMPGYQPPERRRPPAPDRGRRPRPRERRAAGHLRRRRHHHRRGLGASSPACPRSPASRSTPP